MDRISILTSSDVGLLHCDFPGLHTLARPRLVLRQLFGRKSAGGVWSVAERDDSRASRGRLVLLARTRYLGWFFDGAAAFFRTFIGPVIAGAMGERYGWRSFFWLSLGRSGFIMLLNLACFPETMYHRAAEVVAE